MSDIIIVGAGHAAGQAAASLRQEGFAGAITILGDEPHIPYQRPPLSKQYLAGEQGLDRVYLRPEKFYAGKDIAVRAGVRVERIDPAARKLTTSSGEILAYEQLLMTTGSRPRQLNLPGSELEGVHYLRTIADVDAIKADMAPGKRVVVVGGGYIGLEVAAVCVEAGLEVRVLEMEQRILARVTTPAMSDFYHRLHEGRGVGIHTGARVTGFSGHGRVSAVQCGDGSFAADFAVVGIGIVPNVELAEEAGLECDDGILVDERCRTSDPYIYAAGDCTNHPNPLLGRRLRLESVPNAMEQARVAAANLCGKDREYAAVPWFWSDQYELKLQMVGFSGDGDAEVVRGEMAANQFAVFYLSDGKIVAADAVNSPKEFMLCRRLVGQQAAPAALADPNTDLKSLLAG
ncbi:MAG: FAD-dependent oxidoreductase [Gammaproteobacteria bacterium]|nr:FAD-dependent oxidoreductase [Gammaproteobacteria bacterium]